MRTIARYIRMDKKMLIKSKQSKFQGKEDNIISRKIPILITAAKLIIVEVYQ